MAYVRGLHETGGLPALHVARIKAQPGKLATKLARLDHQRELLERQLAVWTEKQQTTKHRLDLVEKQMAELRQLVRHWGKPPGAAKGRKRGLAPGEQSEGRTTAQRHKEMSLEY